MKKYSSFITDAIEKDLNLEAAVIVTLLTYPKKHLAEIVHEITSLAIQDERYNQVFDLFLKYNPGNLTILQHKAIAYELTDPPKAIDALSEAIVILHQNCYFHPDLVELYSWIGTIFQRSSMPQKAIASYSLAVSHYQEDENDLEIFIETLKRRAEEYFKVHDYDLAREDVLTIVKKKGESYRMIEILKEINLQKNKISSQ